MKKLCDGRENCVESAPKIDCVATITFLGYPTGWNRHCNTRPPNRVSSCKALEPEWPSHNVTVCIVSPEATVLYKLRSLTA